MTIVEYDINDINPEEFCQFCAYLEKETNSKVIAIPKNYNVLFDVSHDKLVATRDLIDNAIKEMENK